MKDFLTSKQEELLVEAIREQELRTSAEIRVCVSYKFILFPERYAWKVFGKTGMRATRERNGALIVMIPRRKKIVMIGDSAFDAVVPEGYWKASVDAMILQMHEASPLDALREGLVRLGDMLAEHWPRGDDDRNELPDEILK